MASADSGSPAPFDNPYQDVPDEVVRYCTHFDEEWTPDTAVWSFQGATGEDDYLSWNQLDLLGQTDKQIHCETMCKLVDDGGEFSHDQDHQDLLFKLQGDAEKHAQELREREAEEHANEERRKAQAHADGASRPRGEIQVSFEALKDVDTSDNPVRRRKEEQEDQLHAVLAKSIKARVAYDMRNIGHTYADNDANRQISKKHVGDFVSSFKTNGCHRLRGELPLILMDEKDLEEALKYTAELENTPLADVRAKARDPDRYKEGRGEKEWANDFKKDMQLLMLPPAMANDEVHRTIGRFLVVMEKIGGIGQDDDDTRRDQRTNGNSDQRGQSEGRAETQHGQIVTIETVT